MIRTISMTFAVLTCIGKNVLHDGGHTNSMSRAMDYHHYENEFDEEERPRDVKIDEAKLAIIKIFDNEPERVFYSVQIETLLERDYFGVPSRNGFFRTTRAPR